MDNNAFNTPVLLMLFNRPDITRKLFNRIREIKPSKIFVAANGPRPNVPGDVGLCMAVRDIFKEVDWKCELYTDFPETNINMHVRWYKTMDWFFENVDQGIILEDDCIPDISFFSYCTELLDKYRDNLQVMHINGSNFQFGHKRGNGSYYFSKYAHVWGWATWKRAWSKYDDSLHTLADFKDGNIIQTVTDDLKEKKYWIKYFDSIYDGRRNSCDIKWLYAIWLQNSLVVTPNVNLISNIGYGLSAGHTLFKDKVMEQKTYNIGKIIHPDPLIFTADKVADKYTFKSYFYKNFFQKAFYIISMRFVKILK